VSFGSLLLLFTLTPTLSHKERELKILLIWRIFFAYILIKLAHAKYHKVA